MRMARPALGGLLLLQVIGDGFDFLRNCEFTCS